MTNKLRDYFPLIRERAELLSEIHQKPKLFSMFLKWSSAQQEEFLDFCTGVKGVKILYDSFFKETLNPEYAPKNLESFLCTVLKRNVKIVAVLPNDSSRIADESSLLITDIIVELEDGTLANIEVQKIGYSFPGPRSACYSADMLLRQYKRIRSKQGDSFSYNDIKNVFLIVIYEKSPKEFHLFPNIYYHHAKQIFDSGLTLNLLQEYIMIPLDIFRKTMDNKNIETPLHAWLTFLSDDRPEKIIELITKYPEFKSMYEILYQMCHNTERVMEMFSEELRELDRNTVKYMMEEQQQEIDRLTEQLDEKDAKLNALSNQISILQKELDTLRNK